MEQFEELAEEGLNAVERVWRKVKDVPMNVIVFLIMLVLAGIGWLSRHLTKRAPDAVRCPECKSRNIINDGFVVVCLSCGSHTAQRR